MFYDSTSPITNNSATDFDGNLFNDGTPNNSRGLRYTDLKPAIKAIHIIEAIEDKYDGIEFTRDFFGSNTLHSVIYIYG